MTVLVLARDLDWSADRLVDRLTQRGVPVFRTDLAAFPQQLTLDARLGPRGWDGELATPHRSVRLGEIRSVWYRHPSHFELPEGMSGPERQHAAAEARCGLSGVLASLDVLWVNHPSHESDALKPRQLDVARRCGLRVPDSQITNRPAGVRDFAATVGGSLAGKTLSASLRVESGRLQMAYTRRIEPAELDDLAGVDTTLHLFQPFVPKAWESRVMVVGEQVFAAAIHAGSDAAQIDFRADYDSLDYAVVEPPESVIEGMLAFLRTFGLSFGVFDFAVTPDGEWIMFECNPAGQYAWLEERLELPITVALADLLSNGAQSCHRKPSDAAQLSPQEQQTARLRLGRLADRFTGEGILRSPQWQAVFLRTWRHPYVPVYYPELGAGPPVRAAEQQQRAPWLAAVYSDESLITKIVQVPSPRGPGYQKFTSSSTLPSLMLTMLEALDVAAGCRVLEIGTGSGYNAALLCERLGSELVTSVDIDPELIDLARQRLATNGYTPTLAAVDGAGGYPPHAPYDRIIATCSVPAIPPAWLEQVAPGGIIMTDVHGPLGGTIVKLTVSAEGVATGRFLPSYGSFMPLRTAHIPASPPTPDLVDNPVDSVSDVDPTLLQWDGHIGFIVQWHLPDVIWGPAYAADGDVGMRLTAPDGSGAEAWHTPADNGFLVRQAGPRRLWDRVEEAVTFWQQAGQPNYDRFGVTATTTEQYVWYDHPDSPHRWPLPTAHIY